MNNWTELEITAELTEKGSKNKQLKQAGNCKTEMSLLVWLYKFREFWAIIQGTRKRCDGQKRYFVEVLKIKQSFKHVKIEGVLTLETHHKNDINFCTIIRKKYTSKYTTKPSPLRNAKWWLSCLMQIAWSCQHPACIVASLSKELTNVRNLNQSRNTALWRRNPLIQLFKICVHDHVEWKASSLMFNVAIPFHQPVRLKFSLNNGQHCKV